MSSTSPVQTDKTLPRGRKMKDRSVVEGKSINLLREALNSSSTREAYERRLARFFRDVKVKATKFKSL